MVLLDDEEYSQTLDCPNSPTTHRWNGEYAFLTPCKTQQTPLLRDTGVWTLLLAGNAFSRVSWHYLPGAWLLLARLGMKSTPLEVKGAHAIGILDGRHFSPIQLLRRVNFPCLPLEYSSSRDNTGGHSQIFLCQSPEGTRRSSRPTRAGHHWAMQGNAVGFWLYYPAQRRWHTAGSTVAMQLHHESCQLVRPLQCYTKAFITVTCLFGGVIPTHHLHTRES